MADGLSRTIFRDPNYTDSPLIAKFQKALDTEGSRWVWKDGKDGYEALLASLQAEDKEEVINHGSIHGVSVFLAVAGAP